MTQMEELARTLRLPSIPTLALYAATILTELPVIFARMCITFAVAAIVLLTRSESMIAAERYVEFALIPTLWSIFALITPLGGGWWWLNNMGGREPSEREQTAYHDALQLLQAQSTLPLRLPGMWFVTDEPQPDAAVCGSTLMLSRGLLESEYLPAVLAHELGQLATSDGKLTAAINRLIINPFPKTREKQRRERSPVILADSKLLLTVTLFGSGLWVVRWVVRFARGGFGLMLLVPFSGSTGANASTSQTNTPRTWVRQRSSRTSSRSTPSCTTTPSRSSGSPNIPTHQQSYASTSSAKPAHHTYPRETPRFRRGRPAIPRAPHEQQDPRLGRHARSSLRTAWTAPATTARVARSSGGGTRQGRPYGTAYGGA